MYLSDMKRVFLSGKYWMLCLLNGYTLITLLYMKHPLEMHGKKLLRILRRAEKRKHRQIYDFSGSDDSIQKQYEFYDRMKMQEDPSLLQGPAQEEPDGTKYF